VYGRSHAGHAEAVQGLGCLGHGVFGVHAAYRMHRAPVSRSELCGTWAVLGLGRSGSKLGGSGAHEADGVHGAGGV